MSKRVSLAASLLAVAFAIPIAMADQRSPVVDASEAEVCETSVAVAADEPIEVAQASDCRRRGYSCGTQVITGNSACCDGLVCSNGACASFRGANEACGAGVPPCAPGLTCQAGTCR